MAVDFSLAVEIHETLSHMDTEFTRNPRIPLHAVIGLWDIIRDHNGWHVDVAVYETTSLPAIKAWLFLRCTDLMYIGVGRVVLRSKALQNPVPTISAA